MVARVHIPFSIVDKPGRRKPSFKPYSSNILPLIIVLAKLSSGGEKDGAASPSLFSAELSPLPLTPHSN